MKRGLKMLPKVEKIIKEIKSLSNEEIQQINKQEKEEHIRQHSEFIIAFKKGYCYLCHTPLKSISSNKPCLHWLIRECKFKKKDFPQIYSNFGLFEIQSYLRWVANSEIFLRNINDTEFDTATGKLVELTIKYKHIEWSFSCAESDFKGHYGTKCDFPHYHFQMRINGQQFINYNDFHVPFSIVDLMKFELMKHEDVFEHNFGIGGAGLQEAVTMTPEEVINYSKATNEEVGTFRMSTLVSARDTPISGEKIAEMFRIHKETGIPLAKLAKNLDAEVSTIVSLNDDYIPRKAKRNSGRSKM